MNDASDPTCPQSDHGKKETVATSPLNMMLHAALTGNEKPSSDAKETPLTQISEEGSPFEDLMREHGILSRIIFIYEEIISRMGRRTPFPPEVLVEAAWLVRDFIEDHHGKLEEDFIFPRFEKKGKHVDFVKVLREQHLIGRQLTDHIIALATPSSFQTSSVRKALTRNMHLFNRMFRPHAAREDTLLFPAFNSIVSRDELNAMVEEFETREHELSGGDSIGKVIERVADFEKTLGIHELSRFTPRI